MTFLRDRFWAGGADYIICELHARVKQEPVQYKLEFKAKVKIFLLTKNYWLTVSKSSQFRMDKEGSG